jgi:hypothetical protein
MCFKMKNTLKNNRYHTLEHTIEYMKSSSGYQQY